MHFILISEQTATFAVYDINNWFYIIEVESFFTARYELSPYIKQVTPGL